MKKSSIKVGNRVIQLSNLDKIWFPKSKITKGAIINYYYQVADYCIAHSKNHPLTMQRFPEGITGESFYQKNAGSYFPDWIKTIPIGKEEGGKVHYVISNNPATLVYLANQGAITIHSWLSRYDKLHTPDRMIFDLDPSKENFTNVRKAALLIKEIFTDLKIPCFTMTTGSRGMHVYVPLKRVHSFDYVADFAYAIAKKMIEESPQQFTLEVRKAKRAGKIFIDTLRNRYSATSVMPYAVRPREKAPVAAPLFWDEVKSAQLTSQKFTIKNIISRVKTDGDPWADVDEHAVSLKKAYKQLLGEK
jgi:bifunctional non-homologous end joining protein LigD